VPSALLFLSCNICSDMLVIVGRADGCVAVVMLPPLSKSQRLPSSSGVDRCSVVIFSIAEGSHNCLASSDISRCVVGGNVVDDCVERFSMQVVGVSEYGLWLCKVGGAIFSSTCFAGLHGCAGACWSYLPFRCSSTLALVVDRALA